MIADYLLDAAQCIEIIQNSLKVGMMISISHLINICVAQVSKVIKKVHLLLGQQLSISQLEMRAKYNNKTITSTSMPRNNLISPIKYTQSTSPPSY